jgi:coenzyme F420-reducing hydrogenase beta subunit
MPNLPHIDQCFGCAACIDACNRDAIQLKENANGFYIPVVNSTLCTDCRICEQKCPSLQLSHITKNKFDNQKVYAAWSTNEDIIKNSASGGVFAQVAFEFLQQPHRIVYGATLLKDSTVKHIFIENSKDIALLQNSKYQQSDTTGIYQHVKQALKAGKEVLFSGTPCQIAALYTFLGENRVNKNLYTMEVICHGVPSNYLAQVALKINNAQQIISYRTKSQGWERGNRTLYLGRDGVKFETSRYRKDFHFRAYLSFLWLRKSCKTCPFARIERTADITIGDFWGRNKHKYSNFMGVSVITINNRKGQQLIEQTHGLHIKSTTWEEVLPHNQNLYMPSKQASKGADKIANIKKKSLLVQKLILQQGFTNKWLFGIGQIIETLYNKVTQRNLHKEMKKQIQQISSQANSKRPKVGILTTYFAANFGAMLQPYALKRVLELQGYDVEFIRYKQPAVYTSHKALSLKRIFSNGLNSTIGKLFALPFAILQDNKLQGFKRQFLQTSDDFTPVIPQDKDFYIFGSDQIWNPKNTNGFDDIYFGSFSTKPTAKKIVYAASGECIEESDTNKEYFIKQLDNFHAIAVRELSLKQKLERMTNRNNIQVVVDPTLLAEKAILDELPSKCNMKHSKYVFFYLMRNAAIFLPKVHDFARRHDCKLLIVSSTPKGECLTYALKHKDVTYLPAAGMEDFLGGIRNAQYVFTSSFHGNVFALIYRKPLFSLRLKDGLDTRAHDLLSSLGIEQRIISITDNWDNIPPIPFDKVHAKIADLRQDSINFLINNLKMS